jgi:hypothetical protein
MEYCLAGLQTRRATQVQEGAVPTMDLEDDMSEDVIALMERVERLERAGRRDRVSLAGAAVAGLATLLLSGALALRAATEPAPARSPRMTATTVPAVWRR